MTKPQRMEAALRAVDKMIENLAASDFAVDYGRKCINGLHEYRVDMAADLLGELERKPIA